MSESKKLWQRTLDILEKTHASGGSVVLATGVFDVLHSEHALFLEKAAAQGDILVVGVESDLRVRALKGEGRPIQSQQVRAQQVQELEFVTSAFVLPEAFNLPEHHRALLEKIKPKVLAVSSHTKHQEKKAALMHSLGGELVVVHEHNPNVSTTLRLNRQ